MLSTLREFVKWEAASGVLLLMAAVLAIMIENSPAKPLYDALLDTPVHIRIGAFELAKPLLLWVNDGLMAIFFFLIGLEVKREMICGALSDPDLIRLPVFGAIGGMVLPAMIYAAFNYNDPTALKGWAIPSATDIAFALGVLTLLGKRIPGSLKLFLLTLAIIDDLGAIIIIAIFYSGDLSLSSLMIAAAALLCLFAMNRARVRSIAPYILVGILLWVTVLKSGVHATLAGVLLAMFIPLEPASEGQRSPLKKLEHDLHPYVSFGILPLFAFANTGISLDGLSLESLLHPIALGITAGLFVGNQFGVFGFCWIATRLGLARLPEGASWMQMYGVSLLCGIGFTMSLFIASLAFEQSGGNFIAVDRLGILVGSILSGIVGFAVLRAAAKPGR